MTYLDYWPLFYIYIIIKLTTIPISLLFCAFIIDSQVNIQKRKRANTVQDKHAIKSDAFNKTTIIVDSSSYRKPSNIKLNPDDSDVD